jgi:hypothetical protein
MQNRAGVVVAMVVLAVVAGGIGLAIAQNQPGTAAGTPAATATVPPATAPPQTPTPPPGPAAATPPQTPTPPPATAAAPPQTPTPPPATAAAPPPGPAPAPRLSQAQLDQMLAPIALYPDQLLDQVLAASTYPLEVVEAARWAKQPANQHLRGDALLAALRQQHWDPSVMALVPFPRVLDIMSTQVQWTEALGNAFLAQQADVLAAVQRLRRDAMQAGNLTPAACHCRVATSGGAITIAPGNPAQVYVPVCNPQVAYGIWPYPAYPPVVFPLPVGFVWGPGPFIGFYPFVTVAWYGPLWGWAYFDWWHANIILDPSARLIFAAGDPAFHGGAWVHDPAHRGGVAYADPAVRSRFGARAAQAAAANGRFAHAATDPAMAAAARAGAIHGAAGAAALHGAAGAAAFHSAATAHGAFHSAAAAHGTFHSTAVAHGAFHRAAPHAAFHAAPRAAFHAAPHAASHGAAHVAAHAAAPHGGAPRGGHAHG